MNDLYVPYQNKGEWLFEDRFKRFHGPFVTEEICQRRADEVEARHKEAEG